MALLTLMGCQGVVPSSREDDVQVSRRDIRLSSWRFQTQEKNPALPQLTTDLRGLSHNMVLDEAVRGRLINHYERDMEVWSVRPTREQKREDIFDLGPEEGSDALQIFIDVNP